MGRPLIRRTSLEAVYRRLWRTFGPQQWWPARSPYEVMVGAMLTQSTTWRNVELAIVQLRRARALTPRGLLALRGRRLERLIRSAGYFRQKAVRLRRFSRWYLARYGGRPSRMFATRWTVLRQELLALNGVGPETADSILLYAGAQPVFVADAYTMRVFRRHRFIGPSAGYDDVQQLVMHAMPDRAQRYNEFHALLVAVGKRHCHRRDPDCARCPLGDLPHRVERT